MVDLLVLIGAQSIFAFVGKREFTDGEVD